jgi:hypothetical protein
VECSETPPASQRVHDHPQSPEHLAT